MTVVDAAAAIDPSLPPSGTGCLECEAPGGGGVHQRRSAAGGHVGCCDSSPSQHARRHAAEAGHPVIRSFEPGESWFWDFPREEAFPGPELAPPEHRPRDQPRRGRATGCLPTG